MSVEDISPLLQLTSGQHTQQVQNNSRPANKVVNALLSAQLQSCDEAEAQHGSSVFRYVVEKLSLFGMCWIWIDSGEVDHAAGVFLLCFFAVTGGLHLAVVTPNEWNFYNHLSSL